jgi:hypothetical protein
LNLLRFQIRCGFQGFSDRPPSTDRLQQTKLAGFQASIENGELDAMHGKKDPLRLQLRIAAHDPPA